MAASVRTVKIQKSEWRDPIDVLGGFPDTPGTIALMSSGEGDQARWSYLARDPQAVLNVAPSDRQDPFGALSNLIGDFASSAPDGPPFQGGVMGLCAYELGDRTERLGLNRHGDWPDLSCGLYPAVLAFDHRLKRVLAVGRGHDDAEAEAEVMRALSWLSSPEYAPTPHAIGDDFEPDAPDLYETAVAEVVERIERGEIFQANIARTWRGRLVQGACPFDLFARLAYASPAPFAAYCRLNDKAVVSNSPERFVSVRPDAEGLHVEARPIKGTAPRGGFPEEDAHRAEMLSASVKDRAENLMIVDLMRNDIARVCAAGSVEAAALFDIESFANVHHLVSTVKGRLEPGRTAVDLLRAALPAGSITGAPKVQAMKVISQLEAPRGPFFGVMFWAGVDGGFDSSVLIRTAALTRDSNGWAVEARAGAGIVADSNPAAERRETEDKISALAQALSPDHNNLVN
jgi:para-aminobenzoate synthetase component 1